MISKSITLELLLINFFKISRVVKNSLITHSRITVFSHVKIVKCEEHFLKTSGVFVQELAYFKTAASSQRRDVHLPMNSLTRAYDARSTRDDRVQALRTGDALRAERSLRGANVIGIIINYVMSVSLNKQTVCCDYV